MGINNKISEGYAYYLTLTIEEWIDVFSRPVYKHIIVDSLNYCIANKGLEVYCWCLMSNHLHLIASAKEEGNLSDILRDFKKFTSKAIVNAIKEVPESRRDWMLNLFWYAGKNNKKNQVFQGLAGWQRCSGNSHHCFSGRKNELHTQQSGKSRIGRTARRLSLQLGQGLCRRKGLG